MASNSSEHESKLIVLTALAGEIEDALKTHKKWVTVIDPEGNAEVYFKYQGTSVFSILEKEVAPENLCRSLLTMAKYPRTLTINYLDLAYQNVFNETYFPEEVLDHAWVASYKNLDKLRENFPKEFPEEIWACADFKICFLFGKDNVPSILYEKTIVLEICPPGEIAALRAEREEKRQARKTQKEEEEKKVDVAKKSTETSSKAKTPTKPTVGKTTQSNSASKGTSPASTSSKTAAGSKATTVTKTGATTAKTTTPSKPAVSTTSTKSSATTASTSSVKSSVPAKTVKK